MSKDKVKATISFILRRRQVMSPLLRTKCLPFTALVLVALDEVYLGENEDEEVDDNETEQHL